MSEQRRALAGAALALLAAATFCAIPVTASSRDLLQVSSSIDEFPRGCRCDRSPNNSPWRLEHDPDLSALEFGFMKYCFTIKQDICNTSSTCCNPALGVYKVELDIVPGCKSALKRVTLNGNPYGTWEFNQKLSALRITRLNLTEATAPGTQVCVFLKADSNCTTLGQLCSYGQDACKYSLFNARRDCCPVGVAGLPPSPPPHVPIVPAFARPLPPSPAPPPPPPRSDFPKCVCERSPAGSRLFLQPAVNITPAEKNLTKICFTIGARDVCDDPLSDCCTFDLHKVEFEADPVCSKSLVYSTVDGVRRMRFFQSNPYPALKVTGIDKSFASAAGTEVCVVMKPECNTLKQLGKFHDGTITVALATKPGTKPANCCPLFYAGEQQK